MDLPLAIASEKAGALKLQTELEMAGRKMPYEWGHLLRMTIEIVETAKMAARKSPFLRHIAL